MHRAARVKNAPGVVEFDLVGTSLGGTSGAPGPENGARSGTIRLQERSMSPSYRWVIVAVGALMTCVALGAMFSLAIFLEPIAADTGWSRTGISSAMTLNFLAMAAGAFAWGAISDRFGARIVVLAGAVLLGLALVVASRAGSLAVFQVSYGVLVGIAASAFFAPMIALTTAWFDTNRSLAVSLVSAGMGVAPMVISPFARWLISAYDWRTAMFDIGVMAWVLLLPATLLVRQPPARAADGVADAGGPGLSVAQALRSPQFIVLGLTFFACCAAHSGPIFHMVSYAMLCGVAPMAAVSIYSVEGLAGLGGRLLYGVLADRIGVKPVLVAGLAIQAAVIAAYLAVSRLEHFYLLAVIFGADLRGRDAALCGAGARVFRAAHHRHDPRRRHDALQPRHGVRAARRRHGVRRLRRLRVAVHRLRHGRARRGGRRARLPAAAANAARKCAGRRALIPVPTSSGGARSSSGVSELLPHRVIGWPKSRGSAVARLFAHEIDVSDLDRTTKENQIDPLAQLGCWIVHRCILTTGKSRIPGRLSDQESTKPALMNLLWAGLPGTALKSPTNTTGSVVFPAPLIMS